jgi:hypothetical protein
MWFMKEMLQMCLASKGLGSTHIQVGWKCLGQRGFHMHRLKSFLKIRPLSKIRHPQADHNILWQTTFSANETKTCLYECLRVSV